LVPDQALGLGQYSRLGMARDLNFDLKTILTRHHLTSLP
jgi:hypothetical protein